MFNEQFSILVFRAILLNNIKNNDLGYQTMANLIQYTEKIKLYLGLVT